MTTAKKTAATTASKPAVKMGSYDKPVKVTRFGKPVFAWGELTGKGKYRYHVQTEDTSIPYTRFIKVCAANGWGTAQIAAMLEELGLPVVWNTLTSQHNSARAGLRGKTNKSIHHSVAREEDMEVFARVMGKATTHYINAVGDKGFIKPADLKPSKPARKPASKGKGK